MIQFIAKPFLVLFLLQFTACAVIHFDNGEVIPDPDLEKPFSYSFGLFDDEEVEKTPYEDALTSERRRKWYHHAIFQIAEINNPLQTSQTCSGLEWNQITTEVTPFDAVAGLLDNALLLHASSAWLDIWSPWSVEYSCREQP